MKIYILDDNHEKSFNISGKDFSPFLRHKIFESSISFILFLLETFVFFNPNKKKIKLQKYIVDDAIIIHIKKLKIIIFFHPLIINKF